MRITSPLKKPGLKLLLFSVVITLLFTVPGSSAAEPVLFSQGDSYDPFVKGDYIVYADFSDDPYERKFIDDPSHGVFRGRADFLGSRPIGNIYLYNISSGGTAPVYIAPWRSALPWIENDTVYWYENRIVYTTYDPKDPNPAGIFIYSVPIERIGYETAENYSLLNPVVTAAGKEMERPDFSSDSIEIVHGTNGTSDLFMYYTDPSSGNRTLIASGFNIDSAYPQLYDGRIFWEDYRSGYSQIYVYDLGTGREYPVSPQPFSQYDCSVDGDIVSWTTYGGDLYYTDISGLIEKDQPEENNGTGTPESGLPALVIPVSILVSMAVLKNRRKNG